MKLNTKFFKTDLLSGMVVFLVALPLCLGIAVASGAPPFAGIICGVIAGIVVGFLSSSNVSVSGPAAGLIAIVLVAITDLGYEPFLVAVIIGGLIQLALGFAKAGTISTYFPTSVIEGMLVAIGIIIIKKNYHMLLATIKHMRAIGSPSKKDQKQVFLLRLSVPSIMRIWELLLLQLFHWLF
jgi:MFS superfamily sulfate permease-like transporter